MKCFLLACLMPLFVVAAVPAQGAKPYEKTATLTGTVYDPNAAVIIQARVIAYAVNGDQFEGDTNNEGVYKFDLPPAVYTVVATAPGFCLNRLSRFHVVSSATHKMSLDLVLEVADEKRACGIDSMPARKPEKKSTRKQKIIATNIKEDNVRSSR